ncbi:SCP2 sterol-binding domain-containing protein [Halomonas sp. Bachu 37]|uniref:ubiquinone anaerobic biosynthesis accessory factor UbiT n=1 Tax=Halomonas kashgarensis TaxID=3084920 RepID=UPI003217C97C
MLTALPLPPPPAALLRRIDAQVPLTFKRRLLLPLLNRVFAEPLAEGEFDALEDRRVSLMVEDLGIRLTLTLQDAQFQFTAQPGEATIRGGWREFLCLATRREDPDGLFFQRRLSIEGDTELGLQVKNLLDAQEADLTQGLPGQLLLKLDAWAQQRQR